MIAVQLDGGAVSVVRRPKPRRRPGEALIRLLCGGICNTDIELKRGYYGFSGTPGHEFVGEVVACDEPAWVGKRVTGGINVGCGACERCLRGLERHCATRTVLGIVQRPGAFSEYFTLPVRNLHEIPAGLATETAVFAEPVAAACEILEQVKIPRGTAVAVLGDGKLGLVVAQVLAARGACIDLYGRHEEKMALVAGPRIAARSSNQRGNSTYEYVVEATGSAGGLREAVAMTRPRGKVILKSTVHEAVTLDMAPVIVNEITLVGSRCGRMEEALRLLARGAVRVEPLISARYGLSEAVRAFARAEEKGVVKVLLEGA